MIRINVQSAKTLLQKRALTCARNTIFVNASQRIQNRPSRCAHFQRKVLTRTFADIPHFDMEEHEFVHLADSALEEIFDSMGDVEDAIDDADITLSVSASSIQHNVLFRTHSLIL